MSLYTNIMERAKSAPVVEIVTIEAADAEEILARNSDNRPVSKTNLEQLISDLTDGRWALNGESIVISADGDLNDGQHRLMAVAATGIPITTVITAGVNRESRLTVDQGRARSAGALIAMNGTPYANHLAKVARLTIQFDKNGGRSLGQNGAVSSSAVLERLAENSRVYDAVDYAVKFDRKLMHASYSQVAFWRYLCGSDDRKVKFLDQVAGGEMIAHDDNAFVVRSRMTRENRHDRTRTEIFLRGLSAELSGLSASRIRLMGEFPKIQGIN